MLDIVVYTSTQNISLIFCGWKMESHIVLFAMQDKNWFQLAETDSINSHRRFLSFNSLGWLIHRFSEKHDWPLKIVFLIALFSLFGHVWRGPALATEANVLSGFRFSSAVFFSSKAKRARETERKGGREWVREKKTWGNKEQQSMEKQKDPGRFTQAKNRR